MDAVRTGPGLRPVGWNGYQCAEYVMDGLRRADLPAHDDLPSTPGAVINWAKQLDAPEKLMT